MPFTVNALTKLLNYSIAMSSPALFHSIQDATHKIIWIIRVRLLTGCSIFWITSSIIWCQEFRQRRSAAFSVSLELTIMSIFLMAIKLFDHDMHASGKVFNNNISSMRKMFEWNPIMVRERKWIWYDFMTSLSENLALFKGDRWQQIRLRNRYPSLSFLLGHLILGIYQHAAEGKSVWEKSLPGSLRQSKLAQVTSTINTGACNSQSKASVIPKYLFAVHVWMGQIDNVSEKQRWVLLRGHEPNGISLTLGLHHSTFLHQIIFTAKDIIRPSMCGTGHQL